jgi:hypothetical protein
VPIVLKSGSVKLLEPSGPVMGLLYFFLKTMMAAAPFTVQEVDQEIRMYVEYIKLKCEQKAVHSELTKSKKPVSDRHIFEPRLAL